MKLRKAAFSSLAIALLMSLSCVSVYADTTEVVPGAIVNPYQGEAIVIPGSDSSNVDQLAVPFAAKVSFSYSKLMPYSSSQSKITSDWFHLTSSGSVVLRVVQYPSSSGGDTANVRYVLRASEKGSYEVSGNYTGTSATVIWNQVPAGTYAIEVVNIGTDAVTGNGYVE